MFFRKFVIPAAAVAGVVFAVYTAKSSSRPIEPAAPVADPARSPFTQPVAGAGIVEASTQNITIGTNIPGVVTNVLVKAGDKVKQGAPLFTIDDRSLKADLAVRKASVMAAQASLAIANENLSKLKALPRVEELPPKEARVAEMEAMLEDMRSQFAKIAAVTDERAVSKEDKDKRRTAVTMAEAKLSEAKTDLLLAKAGAWKPDIEIQQAQIASAQAQVESAQAQMNAVQTDLDRLTVKAPVDGTVLQLNLRVGEYAQAGPLSTPLILFGNTDVLHVRIDVDENDAWKIRAGAKATANLRGNASLKTELTFVRIEPYVVPKKSLTGDSAERVDTRVLQVLYSFKEQSFPVYVGQQMDVFIDTAEIAKAK